MRAGRTKSGWPTSPTSRPVKAGSTWPPCSIWQRARWSALGDLLIAVPGGHGSSALRSMGDARSSARRAGLDGTADGGPAAASGQGADRSFGPRQPTRLRLLPGAARGLGHAAVHEPQGLLLRQCAIGLRPIPRSDVSKADRGEPLPHAQGRARSSRTLRHPRGGAASSRASRPVAPKAAIGSADTAGLSSAPCPGSPAFAA